MITISRPERLRLLNQIVYHMTDRLVVLDVHYAGEVAAAAKRIKNVYPGDPTNAHEWDVES